ncbi:hypothetical protein ACU4GD_45070 [Cupriavidus basilensis]
MPAPLAQTTPPLRERPGRRYAAGQRHDALASACPPARKLPDFQAGGDGYGTPPLITIDRCSTGRSPTSVASRRRSPAITEAAMRGGE